MSKRKYQWEVVEDAAQEAEKPIFTYTVSDKGRVENKNGVRSFGSNAYGYYVATTTEKGSRKIMKGAGFIFFYSITLSKTFKETIYLSTTRCMQFTTW
jgi:hypothetical protein